MRALYRCHPTESLKAFLVVAKVSSARSFSVSTIYQLQGAKGKLCMVIRACVLCGGLLISTHRKKIPLLV
ncbi:unnamed protein product [Victoria cruziana]